MKFYCPHCNQKCEAGEELTGASVECPACARPFTVQPPVEATQRQRIQAPVAGVTPPATAAVRPSAAAPRTAIHFRPAPPAPRMPAPPGTPPPPPQRGNGGWIKLLLLLALAGGGYAACRHYGGIAPALAALGAAVRPAENTPADSPAPAPAVTQTPPGRTQAVSADVPTAAPATGSIVSDLRDAPTFAWQSDQGDGTYKNPVLYADYSDPDITRVGADFYLVSSSFVKSPGLSLLRSRDLVNWQQVANVAPAVDGGTAYDLKDGSAYEGGFWAPSIRHSRGTFYVAVQPTFAAGRIYYATDPAGPWKFYQLDRDIYDPGLFIDTDGTGYIVCGHSPQSLLRLSPDFSRVVEERKNFLDSKAEGCHMLRRGRYYYVFNANPSVWPFQLLCSRTTSLTNPTWERRVALTAVSGGHQGAVVDVDDQDHWYGFVHHDSGAIGRMPQVGPVFWENDWPIFGTPEKRDVIAEVNPKPVAGQPLAQVAASDDFTAPALGVQWAWNHNPDPAGWSLVERPGFLRLRAGRAEGFWSARNTLTQKAQGPTCQGVVKLDLTGMKPGDVAGFGTLGKVNGHLYVSADDQSHKTLGMRMIKDKVGTYEGAAGVPLPSGANTLYLRTDLDLKANLAVCAYSTDGVRWTPLGGNFELMFGYGTNWQGEEFAVFCYNPREEASTGWVDVDSFRFTGADAESDLIHPQRGRPRLNARRTTFVADNGQPLRGPYGSTEWGKAPSVGEVARVKELGFNAVHLYAECFDPKYDGQSGKPPGYAAAEVDKYVAMTRDLGLYLVMTIGNGAANGKYNQAWVVDFWKFYAARYAGEAHVLFEVQNEPVAWGPPYSSPKATPTGAVAMEVEAYRTIRAAAPDTPVLLFSYSVLGEKGGEEALKDIAEFNAGVGGDPAVVWSNAAVAFHGYAGHRNVPVALASLLGAGYPCFMTEFIAPVWGGPEGQDVELTAVLEGLGISWMTFLAVPPGGVSPTVTRPEVFKGRCERAGLCWVPDFGIWPVARSAYGNGGQPRATADTRDHDKLTGTLRVECEDFDTGGRDVAYHAENARPRDGHPYRPDEGVAVRQVGGGGGYAVRVERGGWLEYTLDVREPGFYQMALRYASSVPGSAVRCLLGGEEILRVNLENTGGPQAWRTLGQTVFLRYGRQVLRVEVPQGAGDLDWLELSATADGPLASGNYKIINRGSGLALTNHTTPEASRVEQAPFANKGDQMWKLEHLGAGQYRISSLADKHYWSGDAGLEKGINLVWWGGDKPGAHQRFVVRPAGDGSYRIAPVDLGFDLDGRSTATPPPTGAPVVQHLYKGEPGQRWVIQTP